jgi:hypothetical protein
MVRRLLAVAFLLALAPAAHAEECTLATKQQPEINLHAYRGVAVFSLIGRGPGGRPTVVLRQCGATCGRR